MDIIRATDVRQFHEICFSIVLTLHCIMYDVITVIVLNEKKPKQNNNNNNKKTMMELLVNVCLYTGT